MAEQKINEMREELLNFFKNIAKKYNLLNYCIDRLNYRSLVNTNSPDLMYNLIDRDPLLEPHFLVEIINHYDSKYKDFSDKFKNKYDKYPEASLNNEFTAKDLLKLLKPNKITLKDFVEKVKKKTVKPNEEEIIVFYQALKTFGIEELYIKTMKKKDSLLKSINDEKIEQTLQNKISNKINELKMIDGALKNVAVQIKKMEEKNEVL